MSVAASSREPGQILPYHDHAVAAAFRSHPRAPPCGHRVLPSQGLSPHLKKGGTDERVLEADRTVSYQEKVAPRGQPRGSWSG